MSLLQAELGHWALGGKAQHCPVWSPLSATTMGGSPSPGSGGSWVSSVLSVLGIWVLCTLVPQISGKALLVYVLSMFFFYAYTKYTFTKLRFYYREVFI